MSLKQRIPFGVRHRLRRAVESVRSLPGAYADTPPDRGGGLRGAYARRYRRRHFGRFFGPLVEAGELVFDIGANVGIWTEPLRALGFRVVAVEPQRECAARIVARHQRDAGVNVVAAAVGAVGGETELFLMSHSEHAS